MRRGRGRSTTWSSEIRPGAQHEDAVGQDHGLFHVVRDEEHPGVVPAAQVGHEILHAQAGQRVEGGEGLVEEQELGFANEGPGQGHALGLATRQRAGPGIGSPSRPTSRERLGRAFPRPAPPGAAR